MSAANVLQAQQLVEGLQGILKAAHVGAGLKVKGVQSGDLSFIAFRPDMADDLLPVITVRPDSEAFVKTSCGTTGKFEAGILIRIVYAGRLNRDGGEDAWTSKMAIAQSLVCTLMDNWLLRSVPLANGTKRATDLERVEYSPAEDEFVRGFKGDLHAVAVTFRVTVSGISAA